MKRLLNASVIVGGFVLALYAATSPPGVGLWDTAEFQTVAWIAGIAHPTGFPAFVVTGWLFTHLLPFGNPAWRLTIMSGTCTALACAALVASLRRLGVGNLIAAGTGVLFAAGAIIWSHATHAGVESLTLLFGALATANALTWARENDSRALVFAGLFSGLALSTHVVAIWYIPGLLVLIYAGVQARPIPWRSLAGAAGAWLAGLALYAYLPIRSAIVTAQEKDPTRALGLPPGQEIWDTDHPASFAGFMHLVTGASFNASSGLHAIYDFPRYPEFFSRLRELALTQDGLFCCLLAIIGVLALARAPIVLMGLTTIAFFPIPFSMEYGALVDAAKYYLTTLWILALLIGLGANALAARCPHLIKSAPFLGIALTAALALHASFAERFAQRDDHSGEAVITTTLSHTEENAVINGEWSFITPLAYAKYVENRLGTRIPVTVLPREQLPKWSRARPVYWIDVPGRPVVVPGGVLTPVGNTWPQLYRVTEAR